MPPSWDEDEWGTPGRSRKRFCNSFCALKFVSLLYMIICMILGAAILTLGVLCVISKFNYSDVIGDVISAPSIFCAVVGGAVLLATVIGLVGVVVNRACPVKFFLVIAIITFVLQVILVILLYIYRYKAVSIISNEMTFAIHAYNEDAYVASAVNKMQRNWKCCGLRNSSDWDSNLKYACGRSLETVCGTPDSCCISEDKRCGYRSRVPGMAGRLFHVGCEKVVSGWVDSNLAILGAIALSLAIFHTVGIFITYLLLIRIQDKSQLFKLRKRIHF